MWEDDSNRETIAKEEARLDLLRRGAAVAEEIRRAFAGVTLGEGVGLQQAQRIDDGEDDGVRAEYRSHDEKENWQLIPASELNRCYSSLSFFDAEGLRFHLPAYLIADLGGEYRFGMTHEITSVSDDFQRSRLEILNREQRHAIRSYLLHILEDPEYEYERSSIRTALASYWRENGELPETSLETP